MPFRFPLQALLHLRQSLEHQQELRLRAANQQVARVRHALEQLDDRIRQTQTLSSQYLAAGTTGAELSFLRSTEGLLQAQQQEVEYELLRCQHLREQQERVFRQARRERETFESLRDEQLRTYEREQARREQRRLDDLFLMRKTYLEGAQNVQISKSRKS
ncbi:MAG: flagellar FliJ family protein [Candidatus Sulfotelmatobacter sp.]